MELANGCLEIFAALVISILLVSLRSEKASDIFEKRLTTAKGACAFLPYAEQILGKNPNTP